MTVSYEPRTAETFGWYTWGAVVFGETRVPVRALVVIAGAGIWLGTMLIRTGDDGFSALWAHALVLGVLVAIGSLSRTVPLSALAVKLFAGGALMGVMFLLGIAVIDPLLGNEPSRDFVVPALEQALYLAPLLPIFWLEARGRGSGLGATDMLLLAVAVGVGFGLVEEAYVYTRSSDYLSWLPVVFVGPERLAVTHTVWAGLAGVTLGLGLLLRSRGRVWLVVTASGSIIAALDHIGNNYTKRDDSLSVLLNLLTLNGWLVVALFIVGVAVCVGADRYVFSLLPTERRLRVPASLPPLERWRLARQRRAFAHAWFQATRGTGESALDSARLAVWLERTAIAAIAASGPRVTPGEGDAAAPPADGEGGAG